MSPADAERLGLASGDLVRLRTRRGSVEVPVDVTDTMRAGHLALPNGLGVGVPGDEPLAAGVAPNELTDLRDRDEWVGTPWHKHVPAALDVLAR
jgi:formate dehydrogenase